MSSERLHRELLRGVPPLLLLYGVGLAVQAAVLGRYDADDLYFDVVTVLLVVAAFVATAAATSGWSVKASLLAYFVVGTVANLMAYFVWFPGLLLAVVVGAGALEVRQRPAAGA